MANFKYLAVTRLFNTRFYSRNVINVVSEESQPAMLSAPQTSQNSISETRRSKVSLTCGRSLMDWIELTSRRSTAPKLKQGVDEVELSKHASVDDCWILLGERVYDVTDYLLFHPGGIEQLMRAAGTDGTDLFNTIHAWINYDTMLKTCFIGIFKVSKPKTENFVEGTNSDIVNFETANVRAEVSENQLRVSCSKWDQLRDENVSLEFTENLVRLLLHFSSGSREALHWMNLSTAIFDEPFCISTDGKTISLLCKKNDDNIIHQWTSGTYHYKPVLKYRNCEIFEICYVTHNISLIVLRMTSHCRLMVPVGHHVLLRICVNGSLIERPFTPVTVSEDGQFISLMIKFYKNGIFTSKLRDKKCGDLIEISDPLGCFNVLPDCASIVLMLAAGTGLTSMIRFAVERLKNDKKVSIIAFNKTKIDIISDDYFAKCKIQVNHPLLEIIHCLSEDQEWDGEKGIISEQILLKYIGGDIGKIDYRIFISGPDPFIDLAAKLLKQLEIPLEYIHIFKD